MRVYRYKKLLIFILIFFAAFSLGPLVSKPLRIKIAWILSPLWQGRSAVVRFFSGADSALRHQIAHLEAEKGRLQQEIMRITKEERENIGGKAVSASVIYRDPTSWNSTLWVDVGERTNERLGENIVAKNSCVLVGRALVGVVDYVGKKQSRIRLLTDRKLHPSVRSVRGELKNQAIIEYLDALIPALSHNKEYASFFSRIKERLEEEKETLYLAKGFLQGAGAPLWRKVGTQLRGVGFNYDFADAQGEAKRINLNQPRALLQEGDLLVTTGMDGLFPPDLFVAFVTKVFPLREGDVSYKIEARPYLANMGSLQSCTIIPPLEFVFEEK